MKSEQHGGSTSAIDVGNVNQQGFWLLLDDRELFLPFDRFPWFRSASIEAITTIERPSSHHLYWPMLDVDLAVESITHPERYPLVSRGAV
jgi:Protein of unknown function (DUF2442)